MMVKKKIEMDGGEGESSYLIPLHKVFFVVAFCREHFQGVLLASCACILILDASLTSVPTLQDSAKGSGTYLSEVVHLQLPDEGFLDGRSCGDVAPVQFGDDFHFSGAEHRHPGHDAVLKRLERRP